ncbi:MAG: CAP domain-containing protein [Firmicutes bacterium]|nr:CAP domain-containing protein [[Eubacterium] siraeum]MCM1486883.1 CAP domain-containing protein [Bacillota bacterium]
MKKRSIIPAVSLTVLAAAAVGLLAGCDQPEQAPAVTEPETTVAVEAAPETTPEETAAPATAAATAASAAATEAETTPVTTTTAAVTTTWTEDPLNGEQVMYVSQSGIYSRINAIQGSRKINQYGLNDAVTVVARTDTDYYKLSDGNFIHVSYLSNERTVIITAAAEPENTDYLYDPDPPDMEAIKQFAQRLFELTNQERVKYGLPALQARDDLTIIADQRAKDLSVLYDREHYRPNGEKWYQMLYRKDMYYGQMGENIAAGQRSPEEMIDAWMNSEIHRENILSTDYDFLGVGFYYTTDDSAPHYRYYWVQDFYGYYKGD